MQSVTNFSRRHFLKGAASAIGVSVFCFPTSADAATRRRAQVRVLNKTGRRLAVVAVAHKYSSNYKEAKVWQNLPNDGYTNGALEVSYNTGFGTTGRDWWQVWWQFQGDPANVLYVTSPQNFREVMDFLEGIAPTVLPILAGAAATAIGAPEAAPAASSVTEGLSGVLFNRESTVGFKQHILRAEDEGQWTDVVIGRDKVEFVSRSGKSTTGFRRIQR